MTTSLNVNQQTSLSKFNDASSNSSGVGSSLTANSNLLSRSNYSPSLLTTTNTAVHTNNSSSLNSQSFLANTDNLYNMSASAATSQFSTNTTNSNRSTSINNGNDAYKFSRPFNKSPNGKQQLQSNTNEPNVVDKKKIGHREVKDGVVHYKKVSTDELKKSIQFGIVHSISVSNKYPDRDLIMQDFQVVETIIFPKAGTQSTPPHSYNDFKLKVYAPYSFKYLRRKFNLDEIDFMHAIGETELIEISNPGASGSVFYKTSNDKYLLKTVQYQECEFLKTLLAGLTFNLLQNLINNRYSLLPTIYGLYCYQKLELTSMLSDKTNIRIVIMNNLLPSDIPIHEKYDLKGSLYKRKASKQEKAKSNPTFKDLDFLEKHPNGLTLDERYYDNIVSSLKRDCLILQSFGIMDYSLLLGIHNLEKEHVDSAIEAYFDAKLIDPPPTITVEQTGMQSPNVKSNSKYDKVFNITAVPARSDKGERLLLYLGIIDILQSYRIKKKLEHAFKSLITDGDQISVCPPSYYESRFIEFVTTKVFKRATLKMSPARKRLTFKDQPKRIHEEPSSPDNPTQTRTYLQQPQTTPIITDNQKNYEQTNLKNIKAIDSVESVSAILTTSDSRHKLNLNNNNNNSNKTDNLINSQSLAKSTNLSEINEGDVDSIRYDEHSSELLKRPSITPIIDHYKSDNSSLSSNYLANKKNVSNTNSNQNSPSHLSNNQPTPQKFNGNFKTSPIYFPNQNYIQNEVTGVLNNEEVELITYL